MTNKNDIHIFQGMQLDNDVTKHNSKFLVGASNIRIIGDKEGTALLLQNEKGTALVTDIEGEPLQYGDYVGHCIVGDKLILFTKNGSLVDSIYYITLNPLDTSCLQSKLLFSGYLNFNINNKLQTLGLYENDNLLKVYWLDGINQPRVLVLKYNKEGELQDLKYKYGYDDAPNPQPIEEANTQFDFVSILKLEENVEVERIVGSGTFHSGMIQYAFSYYNKYGRESNIFYTTPFYPTSFPDRGASPEETVANSFKITIDNLDEQFEHIRIYSILRTSLDTTPEVKRVIDIKIENLSTVSFVDNGIIGDTIDPTELLYIGGEQITAFTFASKDNTLFLGNIQLLKEQIKIEDLIGESTIEDCFTFTDSNYIQELADSPLDTPYYSYENYMSTLTPGFKSNELYRIGVQLQHKSGKWSDPIPLKDWRVANHPFYFNAQGSRKISSPSLDIDCQLDFSTLWKKGYRKLRAVYVLPNFNTRTVIAQGMLCPTVYSVHDRASIDPFAQASWFLRPFMPSDINANPDFYNNDDKIELGSWVEFRHNYQLKYSDERGGEIQGYYSAEYSSENSQNEEDTDRGGRTPTRISSWGRNEAKGASRTIFAVDQSILTFHSPDVQFSTNVNFMSNTELKLRLVGMVEFSANIGNLNITTSSAQATGGAGTMIKTLGVENKSRYAGRSLVSGLFWHDGVINIEDDKYDVDGYASYMIYPWQKSGSLNNDNVRPADKGTQTSILKSKKLSNLKFSYNNKWFADYDIQNNDVNYDISTVKVFDNNHIQLIKVPISNPSINSEYEVSYYGNIDTILDYTGSAVMGNRSGGYDADLDSIDSIGNWGEGRRPQSDYDKISIEAIKTSKVDYVQGIRMKYLCDKHLVFSLNGYTEDTTFNTVVLPSINNINNITSYSDTVPFWFQNWLNQSQKGEIANKIRVNKSLGIFSNYTELPQDVQESIADLTEVRKIFYLNSIGYIKIGQNIALGEKTFVNVHSLYKMYSSDVDLATHNVNEVLTVELSMYLDCSKILVYYCDSQTDSNIYLIDRNYKGPHREQNPYIVQFAIKDPTSAEYNFYTDFTSDTSIKTYSGHRVPYGQEDDEYDYILTYTESIYDGDINPDDINRYAVIQKNIELRRQEIQEGQTVETVDTPQYPYLFLAELYREDNNPYGDIDNQDILKSHLWIPGGEAINIPSSNDQTGHLVLSVGDTWYSRYDCLKTFPMTDEDENSVVEIGSFLCESRVNLDGRYDKNRGQSSNITANTTNFNLMNPVYSQLNNFFNYRILDEDVYNLNKFNNTITWTKNHHLGEVVDAWTNITVASTLDTEGTRGKITKLVAFYDKLYCFQDTAISRILFNIRTAVPTSDGVPIELANSNRVDGIQYLTTNLGSSEINSIIESKSNIYFRDTNTGELYAIGGEKSEPISISDRLGVSSWFKSSILINSFQDLNSEDIYFSNNTECLAFSEKLAAFYSKVDYQEADAIFNIPAGKNIPAYAFRKDVTTGFSNIWQLRSLKENKFFGQYRPYYIKFISNENAQLEKVFTNVNIRADFGYAPESAIFDQNKFFNYIRVTDSYQDTGKVTLYNPPYRPANILQKKFKVWRIDIPRSLDYDGQDFIEGSTTLQRIRDLYATIELGRDPEGDPTKNNIEMRLHDIDVQYYV